MCSQANAALDDPTVAADPGAVFGLAAGDHRFDAAAPDEAAVLVVVVAAVGRSVWPAGGVGGRSGRARAALVEQLERSSSSSSCMTFLLPATVHASTNKIPCNTRRSPSGLRPGYRKRRCLTGNSGSIRSHNPSGTIPRLRPPSTPLPA